MQNVALPFHLRGGKFDAVIRTMHKKCQFRIATKQGRLWEEAMNKWYSVLLDCMRHVDEREIRNVAHGWPLKNRGSPANLEVMFVELMCLCV